MKDDYAQSLEARYAEALRHEKAALIALQAQDPGTGGNARAWQEWSEAISRTNLAWRELSSYTMIRHTHPAAPTARSSDRGAGALSR